jgi:hypothetical protein
MKYKSHLILAGATLTVTGEAFEDTAAGTGSGIGGSGSGIGGGPAFPKNVPTVFMFQPTHYQVVDDPEELLQWERMMIEQVGMKDVFFKTGQGQVLQLVSKTIEKTGRDLDRTETDVD